MSLPANRTREQATGLHCSRRTHWISSTTGEPHRLAALDQAMCSFYGRREERAPYQAMLDQQDGEEVLPQSVRHLLPRYVCDRSPGSVLEVGCGNGRLYRHLRTIGFAGSYTGAEMAEYLIAANRQRHPEAAWEAASVYRLPFAERSFDLCFSLYVLEHLVFPERGLREMLRVLRPEGSLVLVFPDFAAGGILPSQQIGLSPLGTASQKLRAGRVADALVSLYDSRVRMPRLLHQAVERCGPFPVNTRPLCLCHPHLMAPDVDAVYLASKGEIEKWGRKHGLAVDYPAGTGGELSFQAFMVLRKP